MLSAKRQLLFGAPWSPLKLPSLRMWHNDQGLYQTAGGTPATADDDPVGRRVDQSGNGRHGNQTTALVRPNLDVAILNGRGTVKGDGLAKYLTVGDCDATGDWFIWHVMTGVFSPPTFAYAQSFAGTDGLYLNDAGAGNALVGFFDGATTFETTFAYTNAPILVRVKNIASTYTVNIRTVLGNYSGSAAKNDVNLSSVDLFRRGDGLNWLNNGLAESGICAAVPTDADVLKLDAYLNSYWGLALV